MKLKFSLQIFEKKTDFIKTRLVEADLFHVEERTDGQTDITKFIVAFRNFANTP